ncbi:hypothetical protein NBRC111894_915 [Sporolactobacillus inulinus]|uniref:Uncharacterized protein n=1 Tax=Sporolactobacillus inulinus TaxID=2078 RepID=A0A4Y1Z8Z0_9BACL|nr:hypothetical protein NBRC111894_915 [Sporolactobacillus inulinus]
MQSKIPHFRIFHVDKRNLSVYLLSQDAACFRVVRRALMPSRTFLFM